MNSNEKIAINNLFNFLITEYWNAKRKQWGLPFSKIPNKYLK